MKLPVRPVDIAKGPRGNPLRREVGIWAVAGWAEIIPDLRHRNGAASTYDGIFRSPGPVGVPWRLKGDGHVAAAGLLVIQADESICYDAAWGKGGREVYLREAGILVVLLYAEGTAGQYG